MDLKLACSDNTKEYCGGEWKRRETRLENDIYMYNTVGVLYMHPEAHTKLTALRYYVYTVHEGLPHSG